MLRLQLCPKRQALDLNLRFTLPATYHPASRARIWSSYDRAFAIP